MLYFGCPHRKSVNRIQGRMADAFTWPSLLRYCEMPIRPMEGSNTWGKQHLGLFQARGACCCLRHLKPGKPPGLDSIFSEFILHAVSALKSWFWDFLTSCMRQLKIPKIWRRALIVAIPNPEKPLRDPKSYRSGPINLLCVPFDVLERLTYAHVEPIVDPLLPGSTVDHLTLLTQDIEDSFSAKKKPGAGFVDLRAAYDTVWHRGLTCKLLRLLSDRHMFRMIMEVVGNRRLTLTTCNGKRSRLPRLMNNVPQGHSATFYIILRKQVYFTKSGVNNTTRAWNFPTRRVQNTSVKHFYKKHKILIYFSKNQTKWKLLNHLGLSDIFNEYLVCIWEG